MSDIDAKRVMQLRKETGAPMMDCKKALLEAKGQWEEAKQILRKKGVQAADQRAGRETAEGRVFSYVHAGDRIGVLLEIACETDFVARNDEFGDFGHQLCLHIAFTRPRYLRREDVPAADIERERSFLLEQVREQMPGKPEAIQEKAVEGRLSKFFEERCLLEQKFVKDDKKGIEDLLKETVAKLGENLAIRRFAVFAIGEV